MENQYRDMSEKSKELRHALDLQADKTVQLQQKAENLIGALSAAEMKLLPVNQKALQMNQAKEILKDDKTKPMSPPKIKKGLRIY